jgi:23S rRNA pseudouridine1911/1915/1917 synthase
MTTDKTINFTVTESGSRLDKYLVEHNTLVGMTRTQVQRLITGGFIKVNGQTLKSGIKLNTGDKITIFVPPPAPTTLTAEEIPVNILYEDNDVLVIDKPAGLTVHPAPGHPSGTLVNALLSHLADFDDVEEAERPGIVHRLDKDTSGVMLVAKNTAAHTNLTEQFKSRTINKTYLVLVKGRLVPDKGAIEASIGRDASHRERMAVVAERRGRPAYTEYRVREYLDGYSFLEVKLATGRTHQIRVHFEAIGFPVVGDKIYGVRSPYFPRQFVHAWRIGFNLPSDGKYVEFSAELPDDLVNGLEKLKKAT